MAKLFLLFLRGDYGNMNFTSGPELINCIIKATAYRTLGNKTRDVNMILVLAIIPFEFVSICHNCSAYMFIRSMIFMKHDSLKAISLNLQRFFVAVLNFIYRFQCKQQFCV